MGIIPFLFGAKAGKKKKRSEMNYVQKKADQMQKEFDRFQKTGECKYVIKGKVMWMKPKDYIKNYKKKGIKSTY